MVRVASMFSQLLELFPRQEFHQAARRHGADRYSKGYTSWNQFVAMLFCQLARAQSLREICGGLACCLGKLRHLGVSVAPNKSTLSYANKHRPWELYETVFSQLLAKCQRLAKGRKKFRFRNKLYSLDATVIELSLSLYNWARFRRVKGAVKLHVLLDHEGYLPAFAVITDGDVHDVRVARKLRFRADTVVVMDKAYVDYELYRKWTDQDVWFVTRLKKGLLYEVIEHRTVPANRGVLADEVIELTGEKGEHFPYYLRRVEVWDSETETRLVFLTNHMQFGATTIARIYKDRWQVELFFKALKQNLRIKTFVGTSPNAVRIQLWTALIAILLVKYLQFRSRLDWSLSNLVALLRWNLFTYRDLWAWVNDPFETPPLEPLPQQLVFVAPGFGQHATGT